MNRLLLNSNKLMSRILRTNGVTRHLVLLAFVLALVATLPLVWSHLVNPILPFEPHTPDSTFLLAPAVSITPNDPATTDNLVASITTTAEGSGLDEDTIIYTYEWYKNDDPEPSVITTTTSTTNTLDSKCTTKGQIWKCVVTASDGTTDATATLHGKVTIHNRPPSAPEVAIAPTQPVSADDLMCSIENPSSDEDEDSISYTYIWHKDGEIQSQLTSNTVDSTYTRQGEIWKCMVTASDGTVMTDASDEVTIAGDVNNSPPTTPPWEATYYVDMNNGDDDNNGRTTDKAFETVGRAVKVVQPGDVVHIREGVHLLDKSLRTTTSGTSDSPIVFEAYPNEEVIIDGGMIVIDASWNVLANLEVRNSPQQGIYVLGDDNVFKNIFTHDNHLSGFQIVDGDRNISTGIKAHHNYDPDTSGWHADGIGISSGTGNEFHQCVCWENSDDGFDTWLSSDTILDRCVSFRNGYDDGDGNGFKLGHNGHVTVTRCIAFDNGMLGGTSNPITGFTDNTEGDYISVDHCTALNNQDFDYENYQTHNTWTNNIGHGLQRWQNPSTASHNSWNLGIDDPIYISTDPNSPDFFALRSDSPCRGAATDGTDIGALQYGERITDLIPDWLAIPF
jgi:hypothetical protein